MVRSYLTTRVTDRFTRSLLLCFAVSLVVGLSFAGVAGAQVTADTLEPNDDRSSATAVGSGDSYDGLSIHDSTDEDYFAVPVADGETVIADIDFDHDDGDIDLELLSTTGEELDGSYSTSDGESVSHTAGESGTYYVYV
jgi:Bacterial pre-peptidase C-terminal domain.